MSGRVGTLAFREMEHPLAALARHGARWLGQALEARRGRRRRARARAATMPMRHHLLHDLGMVEADARRLGLLD